ncbi:MAG: peptide deformylase [Thermoleophilia bacterium]
MADHTHDHEHDENCAHDHDHDPQTRPDVFDRIRQYGDPVLRTPTLEITRFDRDLRDEAERMAAIMDAAHGIGLAAPQIGMLSRMAVMRIDGDDSDRLTVLCNPRIVWRSEEEEDGVEGCLSIGEASIAVNVVRALAVRVEAQDLAGNALDLEREGYAARVVQHEVDHLDGVLMLDRTTPEDRRDALRALRRR